MLQIRFHSGRQTVKTEKMPLLGTCFHGYSGSGTERRNPAEYLIQIMFGEETSMLGA